MWLKLPLIGSKLAARPLLAHFWVAITWLFLSVLTLYHREESNSEKVQAFYQSIIPFRFSDFEPLFATCGHMGHIWRADPKSTPGCRGTCPAYHHKLIAQNICPPLLNHQVVQ